MKPEEISKIKKAGEIAKQAVDFAKEIIKPDMPLLEIAEKIEAKIIELGAKLSFPVNLSINQIAAHYTPSHDDKTLAHGLLKVDIGTHIDGYIADTAFSLDLEDSEENKKLIQTAEQALKKGLETINIGVELKEIGKAIEQAIKSFGFTPIQNLSGHSLEQYQLHSGITIPNYDNSRSLKLEQGAYAVEPFSTSGLGATKDGKPSGIYRVEKSGNVRDGFARKVLEFIKEEYKTLPFCSRWIYNKFGAKGLIALKRIEEANLLHNYARLIEKDNKKVAQAEHTILITPEEKTITTF